MATLLNLETAMKKLAFISVVLMFANVFADKDLVQVRSLEVLKALDTMEMINVTQEVKPVAVVDQSADVEAMLSELEALDAIDSGSQQEK